MTQEALARAAGVTPKFVSQIENGHVNPSIGVLGRLVGALRLTFGVFFTWDPHDGDVSTVVALMHAQPSEFRKRLIRAVEVLCDSKPDERAPEAPKVVKRRRAS